MPKVHLAVATFLRSRDGALLFLKRRRLVADGAWGTWGVPWDMLNEDQSPLKYASATVFREVGLTVQPRLLPVTTSVCIDQLKAECVTLFFAADVPPDVQPVFIGLWTSALAWVPDRTVCRGMTPLFGPVNELLTHTDPWMLAECGSVFAGKCSVCQEDNPRHKTGRCCNVPGSDHRWVYPDQGEDPK